MSAITILHSYENADKSDISANKIPILGLYTYKYHKFIYK
jgi:hypothetical protein